MNAEPILNDEIARLEARLEVAERNVRTALVNIDARLPTLYKAQGTFNAMRELARTPDQKVASDALISLAAGYVDMLEGLRKELTKV
jgi:hypothetical protein